MLPFSIKLIQSTYSLHNRYNQCISCLKYVHINSKSININRINTIDGNHLSAQQICNIFALKKILTHRTNVLCYLCQNININELNIETQNISQSKHNLSYYERSLSYISTQLLSLQTIIDNNNKNNMNNVKNDYISYDNINNDKCTIYCRLSKLQIEHLSQTYDISSSKLFIFYTS
jgi:hypothetical protein